MGNLGPPAGNPTSRKPYQKGKARGTKSDADVEAEKEWLVDTGANLSVITKDNGDKFDLTATGGSASGTTGGGGIAIKTGLTMVFKILDENGAEKEVTCNLRVGVKSNSAGSEILGMDQVANVGAKVDWDPSTRTGDLKQKPKPKPKPGKGGGGW